MSIAVNNRRDITILNNRISALIVFYTLLLSTINFYDLNDGINIFNGFFFLEYYSAFFINFILLLSILIILIITNYPRKLNTIKITNLFIKTKIVNLSKKLILNNSSEQFRILEYSLIIIFCISGAIFLISSSDIISIFLSIELQSYSLYLICAIYRNSEYSVSASLMYFLLGSLSSCIILLGISLLYINTGSTNLEYIYIINNLLINSDDNNIYEYILNKNMYIQMAFIILSVGFLFKISAAPFHFWSPDVYNAVPTIVTTFIAVIPKISIFILLYNFTNYTFSINFSWSNNLIISVILSLIIGSILGLTQYKIKRLFAYSTISHIGFILLGLSINTWESSKAFFFYLVQYSICNLNAFIILIIIGYTLYTSNDKISIKDTTNSPIQYIYQLRGYFYINPMISISLIITLFSLVGIPPMIGFFAKQMILNVALNQGYILTSIIAISTSVISAVYYLVIVKNLFFFKPELNHNKLYINYDLIKNINISEYFSFIISILTLFLMSYFLYDNSVLFIFNK
jgi:NADH-ubiquinone oxidoreductase chain 2